jgi:hypothetical protein
MFLSFLNSVQIKADSVWDSLFQFHILVGGMSPGYAYEAIEVIKFPSNKVMDS